MQHLVIFFCGLFDKLLLCPVWLLFCTIGHWVSVRAIHFPISNRIYCSKSQSSFFTLAGLSPIFLHERYVCPASCYRQCLRHVPITPSCVPASLAGRYRPSRPRAHPPVTGYEPPWPSRPRTWTLTRTPPSSASRAGTSRRTNTSRWARCSDGPDALMVLLLYSGMHGVGRWRTVI